MTLHDELEALLTEWGAESEPNQYAYWKQLRALLAKFPPLIEAEIRGQVAADCRVEAENVDLEVPNAYREGTRDGYLSAATIAEGSAS